MDVLNRRVVLVTGKGGVGRTTVAVALARLAAREGKRVLLTEVGDPEGGYSAVGRHFGVDHLEPEPKPIGDGVLGAHLWARSGHEAFLSSVLPAPPLIRAAVRSKALSKFLVAAPSFHEMGVFYHLLTLLEATRKDGSPEHQLVIIDMPATGHALALTGLPDILLRLIPGGPIAHAMKRGQAFMNDPRHAAAWVVTLPEQLPVTESLELLEGLRETNVPAGAVVLNRTPADPFTPDERAALDAVLHTTPMHGELAFRRIGTASVQLARLRDVDVPVLQLPESVDPEAELPDALRAELAR